MTRDEKEKTDDDDDTDDVSFFLQTNSPTKAVLSISLCFSNNIRQFFNSYNLLSSSGTDLKCILDLNTITGQIYLPCSFSYLKSDVIKKLYPIFM